VAARLGADPGAVKAVPPAEVTVRRVARTAPARPMGISKPNPMLRGIPATPRLRLPTVKVTTRTTVRTRKAIKTAAARQTQTAPNGVLQRLLPVSRTYRWRALTAPADPRSYAAFRAVLSELLIVPGFRVTTLVLLLCCNCPLLCYRSGRNGLRLQAPEFP
jgi:hypothetical protein